MKILIVSKEQKVLYNALIFSFKREMVEYDSSSSIENEIANDITNIIYIDNGDSESLSFLSKLAIPIVVISNSLKLIDNDKSVINYVITPLVNDESNYTLAQNDYLYKKGIYSIIIDKIFELINNDNEMNGLVIDVSHCKTKIIDWVFKFDSIAETYAWLSEKKISNPDFTEKNINFYHEKVYNDSLKEINYLADKIKNIQNKHKAIDLFICTRDELRIFRSNYFFKLLLRNLSDTYHLYIVDKDVLREKESTIFEKILDGVAIFEDCVYVDDYEDEYSLGRVDCNNNIILEYNNYFDYIMKKYGQRIYAEDDINGI